MYPKFEKVRYEVFKNSGLYRELDDKTVKEIYDNIKLPQRATIGSAGYDFFIPSTIGLEAGSELSIPTGIRCYMPDDMVLLIFPRSGLGIKSRVQLNNTCAIIDADFYNSDDGGHIWISIINDNRKGLPVTIPAGKGFCQGIFTKFYTTEEDNVSGTRNGGFGSTDGDSV